MSVKLTVCDIPGCEQPADIWHFTPPEGTRRRVDLCDEHVRSESIWAVIEQTGDGVEAHSQVKSMEQVRKEAEAARKAASRKISKKR